MNNHREDELIDAAIAAFNADDAQTHRSHPDSREHYRARHPIIATDCDYEVVGFSGVQGRNISMTTYPNIWVEGIGRTDGPPLPHGEVNLITGQRRWKDFTRIGGWAYGHARHDELAKLRANYDCTIRDDDASAFNEAEAVLASEAVTRCYGWVEWNCLEDDGKVWIAAIVAEAQRRAFAQAKGDA